MPVKRLLEAFRSAELKLNPDLRDAIKEDIEWADDITDKALGEYHRPAEEQLKQLFEQLPRLEAEVSVLKVNNVSAEEVIYEAKTLYEQWPKLDNDQKRTIIEATFERIEFWDGKLRIRYSGLPTSEELCKNQQQMAPATC